MLTFLLFVAIPNGNPAVRLAGRTATPRRSSRSSINYGFDQPIYVQYVQTMKNIFTGKAYSYTQGFNVLDEIKAGLPATLSLAIGAGIIWLLVVDPVRHDRRDQGREVHRPRADRPVDDRGLVPAVLPRRDADLLPRLQGEHLPARRLRAVHAGARRSGSRTWSLPWFTLSILFIGFYSRVLRSTILDTINEDYVRTAHAKGLSERQVLIRHILRNCLIPIISLWGLDFAAVIGGGAILTESVFNLHGVGQFAPRLDRPARRPPDPRDRDADRVRRRVPGAVVDILYAVPRSADPA